MQQTIVLELSGRGIEVLRPRYAPSFVLGERCLELLAGQFGKCPNKVPIIRGDEGDTFSFPLYDQAYRYALNSASRKAGAHFLPKQLGDIVAVQPVEDAASFLRFDKPFIDITRALQRFVDRRFRDLVEHEPPDGHLGFENLAEVPTDRLSLTIFVRGEVENLRLL